MISIAFDFFLDESQKDFDFLAEPTQDFYANLMEGCNALLLITSAYIHKRYDEIEAERLKNFRFRGIKDDSIFDLIRY